MVRLVMLAAVAVLAAAAPRAATLDLSGFIDEDGAVSVQYAGDTVDPYFALQAFLLAHDQGLDARADALRFARWLLPRQKPDATFDRFCRRGPVWAPCKTADADDALLALWIRFVRALPPDAGRAQSALASAATLARLYDPARGIYLVSPVYQHGLFIDNLEVWSLAREPALAAAIQRTFWDPLDGRYLVSTQPGQKHVPGGFYPDAVAQVYPHAVGFPLVPAPSRHFAGWMRQHRAQWLAQVRGDFAWGLIAVVALGHGDRESAACWLREALPYRHGPHWMVTDEVSRQVLLSRGVAAATPAADCG